MGGKSFFTMLAEDVVKRDKNVEPAGRKVARA